MEPPPESFRRWDLFGTLLASVILVAGSLVALFGSQMLGHTKEMFAEMYSEMGAADLPIISKVAMKLQQVHLPAAFILSLLFVGIFMLVKITDRPRANLYAGLTGMLLALTGGGLIAAALLPMLKVISMMGA